MEKAHTNQQESCKQTLCKIVTKPIDFKNLKEYQVTWEKMQDSFNKANKQSALTINSRKQATEQEKEGKGSTGLVN